MTSEEWQAHMTREVAKAIGAWLEERGRLNQPIRSLTMPELEAVAANAISTFVVLASEQLKSDPENAQHLSWLLAG
jgi:hypothetical protein